MIQHLMVFFILIFGGIGLPVTSFAASNISKIRVVSQTVGSDELLVAVARPEQIAALSHLARNPTYSGVADEAKTFPQLKEGDAETILRFAPTLVLFADYSRIELVEQIKRAGVRTLVFSRYHTLDDAYENLRLLALELATENRASQIISQCKARVANLETRLKGVRKIRVIAPSPWGLTPGDQTTFQDLCDHAGAENLAATLGGLHGHVKTPTEKMLSWPVEVVVLDGTSMAEALAPIRDIPPYQFMSAVRERKAALLRPGALGCVSHLRVYDYEQLARELHPEVFQ